MDNLRINVHRQENLQIMLRDSFFKINQIEESGNTYCFVVSIHPGHEVFKGHFPQQPVAPGVFALQMIKECLEWVRNKKYRYCELTNCKFSRPIFPEQDKDFRIDCEYKFADSFLLNATVRSEDAIYLTLKAKLEEV